MLTSSPAQEMHQWAQNLHLVETIRTLLEIQQILMQWVENEGERTFDLMYLDDKASPKLVGTMLQHSFEYAHLKALQHVCHLKEDFIVLAQHLDEANDETILNHATTKRMHAACQFDQLPQ